MLSRLLSFRSLYLSLFILVCVSLRIFLSNVREAYSRYTKDNEQQQKWLKNGDEANGKRARDVVREELEEKENQLLNEQKTLQEELNKATKMLEEGSTRLAKAISDREFHEICVAEVLVTAANAKLAVLKNQSIENSESLNRLRKKNRKNNCLKRMIEIND